MLSSAVGNVFDYGMLTLIGEEPPEVIAAAISRAVHEEYILPADHRYAIFSGTLSEAGTAPLQTEIRLKFAHDRIQQAFYQMLDAERGKRLHLSIGRLLLKNYGNGDAEDKIVDIAAHMNKGLEFISERSEIEDVIALNLRAAQKAKAGYGYDSAFILLEAAIKLLPENSWLADREQTAEIYRLYAECGYLTHHVEQADQACSLLQKHTTDRIALAEIYEMQANHYMYLGMMPESIAAGRQGLQALGIRIPAKVGMASVLKELLVIKAALRGRTPEGIFTLPEMKDPEMKLVMRLLINFIPPSFISGETSLFGLVVLKKVGLTLKYGNSPSRRLLLSDTPCYCPASEIPEGPLNSGGSGSGLTTSSMICSGKARHMYYIRCSAIPGPSPGIPCRTGSAPRLKPVCGQGICSISPIPHSM